MPKREPHHIVQILEESGEKGKGKNKIKATNVVGLSGSAKKWGFKTEPGLSRDTVDAA